MGEAPFGWKVVPAKDGKHKTVVHNPKEVAVWERIAECLIDRRMSSLATARERMRPGCGPAGVTCGAPTRCGS